MGKRTPTPPPAVDPVALANAQADSNQKTAEANQKMNMISSYGPDGSVTYRADPNAPSGYAQYTELSPDQQRIYDSGNQAQIGALGIANSQLGRLSNTLGQSLNPPQLQTSYATSPIQGSVNTYDLRGNVSTPTLQSSVNPANFQTSFNPGQQIQGSVGPTDFSADRQAVSDAVFNQARSRLDPMWNQAEDRERNRLSNQGLSQNSTAYQNSINDFNRGKNDAYNQAAYSAIQAGSDQQQRLFDQSLQQGQFANNAAGQGYAQNQGLAAFGNQAAQSQLDADLARAGFYNQTGQANFANDLAANDFYNQAQNARFGNDLSAGQFANSAAAQRDAQAAGLANFGNSGAQANFQNTAYASQLPLQQFLALMGQGQVAMPGGYSGPYTNIAGTDVIGANALAAQTANQNYANQLANQSATNQALGGLAGAVLGANPWSIFGKG